MCLTLVELNSTIPINPRSDSEQPREGFLGRILRFLEFTFNASAVAALCYLIAVYCFDWDTLEPKLKFTQSDFNRFVAQCSLWSVYVGAVLISTNVVVAVYKVTMLVCDQI